MTAIENKEELEQYQSLFDDLWESVRIRYSTLELPDDVKVPNGEIIFSEQAVEPSRTVLYSEGPLEIVEETKPSTFDFLWNLLKNQQVIGKGIELTLCDHRVEQKFVDKPQARVQQERPRAELHAALEPNLETDQYDTYAGVASDLEDMLQRADEPYFDLSRCEYQYLRHHFRNKSKGDSEILVFAPTGIELTIGDTDTITVIIPPEIEDQTALSILPQRPYGVAKGQRIELASESLHVREDGRLEYTKTPDLKDIERSYIMLFVGDKMMHFEDYYSMRSGNSGEFNPRKQLFDEHDQRGLLEDYLEGKGSNVFEHAVLNTLSIAGYIVQWFGDSSFKIPNYDKESAKSKYGEIDIIAHAPDGSHILFVECTEARISEKRSILDRMDRVVSNIGDDSDEDLPNADYSEPTTTPVVATPQPPEELNDQVVANLEDDGILILHGQRLQRLYERSHLQTDPVGLDFDDRDRM